MGTKRPCHTAPYLTFIRYGNLAHLPSGKNLALRGGAPGTVAALCRIPLHVAAD